MDNAGGSGVVLVQFLVDGGVVASDAASPYTATFNSAGFVNGSHAFSARAWDAAGNTALSARGDGDDHEHDHGGAATASGHGRRWRADHGYRRLSAAAAAAPDRQRRRQGSDGLAHGNRLGGNRDRRRHGTGEKAGGVSGGCGCSAGQGPVQRGVRPALLIGLLILRRPHRGASRSLVSRQTPSR